MELTTLEKVKRALGIAEDDTSEDEDITDSIEAAEDYCREICNRPEGWTAATQTETFDGEFSGTLVLTYTPIDTDVGIGLTIDGGTIDSDTYVYDARTGVLRLKRTLTAAAWDNGYPLGYVPTLGAGVGNVVATYTGGYAADEIPAGLGRQATAMAASIFRERDSDPSVQSERLGDHSVSYGLTGSSEFMESWANRLGPWIRDNR